MNMNHLINMIMRAFMRQFVNRGVSSVFNLAGNLKKKPKQDQHHDETTEDDEIEARKAALKGANIDRRKMRSMRRF